MIKFYQNIFDDVKCTHVANGMLKAFEEGKTVKDNTEYSNGAIGFFNLKESLDLLFYVHKIMQKDYGPGIKFQNTYTRIYTNNNCLKCHTDRSGLDLTISICLYSNLNFEWPLYISNSTIDVPWNDSLPIQEYKNNSVQYNIPIGAGVAALGGKHPHWRETLNCDSDQKVIQVFYHWSI